MSNESWSVSTLLAAECRPPACHCSTAYFLIIDCRAKQSCLENLVRKNPQTKQNKSMSPSNFCYQKFSRIGSYERIIRAVGNVNLTSTGYGERSHSDLKQAYPYTNKHGSREVDSQASPSNKHYHASTHVVPTLHAYSCICNIEPSTVARVLWCSQLRMHVAIMCAYSSCTFVRSVLYHIPETNLHNPERVKRRTHMTFSLPY